FSPRPPRERLPRRPLRPGEQPLKDGDRVLVVGGGIAGSSFCHQLLSMAQQEKRKITVYLINSTSCNYCGGLITGVAQETLEDVYGLEVPHDLILKKIESCVYLNQTGSGLVQLHTPMTAILRTSKFGVPGFDDSIKRRAASGLMPPWSESLIDIEPTIVTKILPPAEERPWRITLSKLNPDHTPMELEGEVLVMAAGFKSLQRPMLKEFQEATGYQPPPTMPASVTELDTGKAIHNTIGNQMFILDGLLPGCVVAFIPKGETWMTVTSLGRKLEKPDLDLIFGHPLVRQYIDLPNASQTPRCHTICGATVFTGPARRIYGDGWVVIGDLAGHGRVLKDGYYAAFVQGRLAAETLIYHGASRSAWERHFHRPLKKFLLDNRVGHGLFRLNRRLQSFPWFSRFLIHAMREEGRDNPYGGCLQGGIRALASGELNYRLIFLLLLAGMLRFALLHPLLTISSLLKKNNS
ncbi:MAG: hypothetical protein M1609_08100, partial [Firmicutes bacterium]|nr:hypothetical protein [Bacillota bacterium]